MRIAVFSDTHGSLLRLPAVQAALPPVDAVLHLGDYARDGDTIAQALSAPCYAVRGNCDFRGGAPWERVVEFDGVRIFMTHGHRYASAYTLSLAAEERQCRAALFGHTHRPLLADQGDCLLLNPGSLSQPRGCAPSYALLTIKNGVIVGNICSV